MERKSKYKKLYRIDSIAMFSNAPGNLFFFNDKVLHRGFIESWQYRTLNNFIKRGMIYAAEKPIACKILQQQQFLLQECRKENE